VVNQQEDDSLVEEVYTQLEACVIRLDLSQVDYIDYLLSEQTEELEHRAAI